MMPSTTVLRIAATSAGAVTQGLLRRVVLADVAEHQHRADHPAVAVANRGATVGDIAFAAVGGNQYGVVGQALDRPVRQGFDHRDGAR
jgi:hypothetical protein